MDNSYRLHDIANAAEEIKLELPKLRNELRFLVVAVFTLAISMLLVCVAIWRLMP